MEMTLNTERRLFVFKYSDHVSCLGFDVVYGHCKELARRIKKLGLLKQGVELKPVLETEIGTPEQYQQYRDLLAIVGTRKIGTWFDYRTPQKVRDALEEARRSGRKVRIFYGDTKTGRSTMDEYDMVGRVGRSCGTLQIPLLVADGNDGGGGILDSYIVRIIDANTRADLYRHKDFHVPDLEIRRVAPALVADAYTHGVWVKNDAGEFENHANFRSYGKAAQWVAFMTGDCTEQPE